MVFFIRDANHKKNPPGYIGIHLANRAVNLVSLLIWAGVLSGWVLTFAYGTLELHLAVSAAAFPTIDGSHSSLALMHVSRHRPGGTYVPTGTNDILSLSSNEPGEILCIYLTEIPVCLCKGISVVAEVQINIISLWRDWKSGTKSELCIQEIILQTHSLTCAAILGSHPSLRLLNSGWQMRTFAEVLCVKLRTADTFPIVTVILKRMFYLARRVKGQGHGQMTPEGYFQ